MIGVLLGVASGASLVLSQSASRVRTGDRGFLKETNKNDDQAAVQAPAKAKQFLVLQTGDPGFLKESSSESSFPYKGAYKTHYKKYSKEIQLPKNTDIGKHTIPNKELFKKGIRCERNENHNIISFLDGLDWKLEKMSIFKNYAEFDDICVKCDYDVYGICKNHPKDMNDIEKDEFKVKNKRERTDRDYEYPGKNLCKEFCILRRVRCSVKVAKGAAGEVDKAIAEKKEFCELHCYWNFVKDRCSLREIGEGEDPYKNPCVNCEYPELSYYYHF